MTLAAGLAHGHGSEQRDLPVAHVRGGGPAATDCLGGLELVGYDKDHKKKVICRDGDPTCDRDRLANGRCEFWLKTCVNNGAQPRCDDTEGVTDLAIDHDATDFELVTIDRTLEHMTMPAMDVETCSALTKLTVALGTRKNGKTRKAKKVLRMTATGAAGTIDRDAVKFICQPPKKRRKGRGVNFATIETQIFGKQCAFSGCHGLNDPQGDLVLEGEEVWESLVDVPAATSSAAFSGKRRVVPGAPDTSFLMDKILGKLSPGEGAPMPLNTTPLSNDEITLIRKWISAGAPQTEPFGGAFVAQLASQPRIPEPDVPDGGYQLHMDPFLMGDVLETEGCQFRRLGNAEEMDVRSWELFMHEGSHHVIIRAYRCADRNNNGTNDCDEPGFDAQFPDGFNPCGDYGPNWAFIVGAQTPHFQVDYQTPETGVALRLRPNQPILINSHYTNPFEDTLAEVWVNLTTADSADVRYPARILFETVANAFIRVPPGTANTDATAISCAFTEDPFCELNGEPGPATDYFALMGLTSHMHKRSSKFVTNLFDTEGAKILRGEGNDMTDPTTGTTEMYVSTDYSDPVNMTIWPPIVVQAGQQLRYTCSMDNGVEEPVRLGCEEEPGVAPGRSILEQVLSGQPAFGGVSRFCSTDADCEGFGTGRCVPANLVFGELAEDDMCILPGLYYRCGDTPESCFQ